MSQIKRSIIVPYTDKQMFGLVKDIANYPKYLPWCKHSEIRSQTDTEVIGAVYIEYLKVKTHFVTRNINTPYSKIDMILVEGPFKNFCGSWGFTQLGENGCRIDFILNYKFSNILLEKIIGPVFEYINKNIINCFIAEAHKQYGNKT